MELSNRTNSFKSKLSRKMKKYSCMLHRDTGIPEVCSSKYIMVCNAGLVSGIKQELIVNVFSKYSIKQITMVPGKSYCFVELNNENVASNAVKDIHGKYLLAEVKGPLYLMLIEKIPKHLNFNSCPLPDGLSVLYDFITEEEEKFLINFCTNELENPETPENNLKHRIVKHFGYVFDYKTNNVDKSNVHCPPIPLQLNFILERLKNFGPKFERWTPDQLTVNFYAPGQGIPPHVDTHSAFDDTILSLSVGSDIVMDFKNIRHDQYPCVLPKRSILVMSGDSRYGWSHGITPRKYDTVKCADGLTTRERSTRISFTFRKTVDNYKCTCSHPMFCDSQKVSVTSSPFNIDNEVASELEKIHVHEVYNNIADHFSETRHKPWPNVETFVKSFDVGSILIDVGCGNGKYLGLNTDIFQIGCDRSEKFVAECYEKGYETVTCDCLELPFRTDTVDCCVCIAVIHHLSTEDRRVAAIKEIVRILRSGGKALIYVWAKDQRHNQNLSSYLKQQNRKKSQLAETDFENYSVKLRNTVDEISLPVHVNRTQFKHEDMLVPWKKKPEMVNSCNAVTFLRYYHVFDEGELEKLCSSVNNVEILKSYYDQGNWCVMLQKRSQKI